MSACACSRAYMNETDAKEARRCPGHAAPMTRPSNAKLGLWHWLPAGRRCDLALVPLGCHAPPGGALSLVHNAVFIAIALCSFPFAFFLFIFFPLPFPFPPLLLFLSFYCRCYNNSQQIVLTVLMTIFLVTNEMQ